MVSSTCFSKVKDCSKASEVAALKLSPFIWSLDRTGVRQTLDQQLNQLWPLQVLDV